ncbi:Zn-dependent protease (includes SpoIVFB) [Halogranum gelatinilyticum]|uniref:Zinc metalloprotease n=1 Tax=Halogranum gelatinilyticum TaxID=660521 RepID=A0A1G9UPS8_9EURY|nr:site-2 protease family protein [Halogranum gelatinilyticum]SDM61931.1 Zn-dependent protease (includes SpoIVFB) [Halogranum gelatinilyticum]
MRSFTVVRLWGIPIRVNLSLVVFLPVLAWLVGSGGQIALYASVIDRFAPQPVDVAALTVGWTPWLVGSLAALGLFAGVTVHELGHALVARRYGLHTESITLWIFGGLARFDRIPREWDREFWIALAGPATSVLVGVACAGLVQVVPGRFPVAVFVAGWLAVVNVTLALFNLLPAFPMDGGRVLRALLARNRPYGVATRIAASLGVTFALVFAVLGVLLFNPVLILVALFVYSAAKSEARVTVLDDLLDGLSVADVMDPVTTTLGPDDTVATLVTTMLSRHRLSVPVVDDTGVVGVVRLEDLRDLPRDAYETTRLDDLVVAEPPVRVDAAADAFETLVDLGQRGVDDALVESGGEVVGTVSQGSFFAAIEIQRELRRSV